MGFLARMLKNAFDEKKPEALKADVRMLSGCEDHQTSADVSCVSEFCLPDPAGRAGGACTASLLNILYRDEETPSEDLSFVEVLTKIQREDLESREFTQIPQLSASKQIDVNAKFDLVPDGFSGTKRALLIGINYIGDEEGELSGCHNDVHNMVTYIKNVHGYEDDNITILLDDGEHVSPTRENIIDAYKTLVAGASPGDSLFCHYSGHGCSIKDDDRGEEADGFDEALVPVDCESVAGLIRDDDLLEILVKPLPEGCSLFCLMDCCHSGSILDLPYHFRPGAMEGMEIEENYNFKKLLRKFGNTVKDIFD